MQSTLKRVQQQVRGLSSPSVPHRLGAMLVMVTAALVLLLAMTLLMNGLAIYIRYRIRKGMR